MLNLRKIREADAEVFLNLGQKLDEETQFMMLEPGERTTSLEEQRKRIETVLKSKNQMIWVAEEDGLLAGFLMAAGGAYQRDQRSAYLVTGVLQSHAGRGIGTRLFHELEEWARSLGIHRLELTVMTHNSRALNLYKKMGFEIEGTKRDSLFVSGKYVDEYYMAKLI